MEGTPRTKVAFLAPLCISIINLFIISYHFIYKDSDGLMDAVMKAEDQVRILRTQLQNSEKSFNIEKEKTDYLSRLVHSKSLLGIYDNVIRNISPMVHRYRPQ